MGATGGAELAGVASRATVTRGEKSVHWLAWSFDRNPYRDRFQALEPGGRLEVGALFAAMQRGIALRAIPAEVDAVSELRRAVVAARRGNRLHQPGKAWAGYVYGRTWTLRTWAIFSRTSRFRAIRVHVSPLSVFAISIHQEALLGID